MKTPKANQLPSGNWNIRVRINGKRYSCTGKTKKEVQQKAKELYAGTEAKKRSPLTVGDAIDKYIEAKKGTLSPSTVKGYLSIRKNYFKDLMKINLSDLTPADIQLAVSNEAINGKSAKTIRNAHGLLSAALDEYAPDFKAKTRLPQKQKNEIRIPSEDEMSKIWQAAKGSKYELSILFASWMGLRMSEIRGLKFGDVKDGRIHVHTAVVAGPDGDVEKGPKTEAGDRWIKLPETIAKLISERETELVIAKLTHGLSAKVEQVTVSNSGVKIDANTPKEVRDAVNESYICPFADITIYKNFKNICEKAGVEPCRFHDLRHFAASEAHALGVPDKYAMRRMGHKTDNMLKTVYQHIIREKDDEFGDVIDKKMEQLYNN